MGSTKHLFLLVLYFGVQLQIVRPWPNQCTYSRQKSRESSRSTRVSFQSRTTYNCGVVGWKDCSKYRTRHRYKIRYSTTYYTEYYQTECYGFCDGSRCSACRGISHCAAGNVRCSTSSNHYCLECEYTLGPRESAYALLSRGSVRNGRCQEKCNWLRGSGRSFCYPGTCNSNGPPSTCRCTNGFSGNDCLTISKYSDILSGLATLRSANGGAKDVQVSSAGLVLYLNTLNMNTLQVTWSAQFTGANSFPTRPGYVHNFAVGLTSSSSSYTITSEGNSRSWNMADQNTHTGNGRSLSYLNPLRSPKSYSISDDITHTFQHGDRVGVTIRATNGGFIDLTGHPTPSSRRRETYRGRTLSYTASFIFDTDLPYQCAVTTTCANVMLDRGPPFTKQATLRITWSGWEDDLSRINKYRVKVMPTQSNNGELTCDTSETNAKICEEEAPASHCSITVTDPGNYCVELTVTDNAENHKSAIRYVLFDDTYSVELDQIGHYPLWVASASKDSDLVWQTDTHDSLPVRPKVHVKWPGHFKNEHHHLNGFLGSINIDHLYYIDDEYDDPVGQPPVTRSRQAIPNANGTVSALISFSVDHQGGDTLSSPADYTTVENFLDEEIELDIPRADGDTVRIWVKVFDVMGNAATDNVTVHIDSSPPVLGDIYLTKDGVTFLAVHDSTDLYNMRVIFEAFDDHSGLYTIHWALHDMEDEDIVHGNGTVAVRKPSALNPECDPPDCACIPKDKECNYRNYEIPLDYSKMSIPIGTHDYDYIITITVTNNARLQTTRQFQISVDTSPPHQGSIHDSRPGEVDLDFQQDYEIFASWDGFFDRESGIMMYVYHFGESCLEEYSNISFPTQYPLQNTTSTHTQWTAPGPGKYHCTVIAYNKALEPSLPVCSDGVTIDITEPSISLVEIDELYRKPGILKDASGSYWFVNERRYRQPIMNVSQVCRDIAVISTSIDLYLILDTGVNNTYITFSDSTCISFGSYRVRWFLRKENHLHMLWKGEDEESGVFDYNVGLSSSPSGMNPDIMPFTSTKGHTEFLRYHPNLGEGVEFYIVIKSTNRAGLTKEEIIGPVVVEITPPIFSGDLLVNLEVDVHDEEFLVARWTQGAFYDDEDMDPLNYDAAVGDVDGGANLIPFTPIESISSDPCQPATTPPSCVAIGTSSLHWHLHGQQVYYVSIKVENTAGLSVIGTSQPYRHDVLLPMEGYVYETKDPVEASAIGELDDIDFQTSTTELYCRWSGFHHPYQDILYEIALGTSPGNDDTVNFIAVAPSNSSHTFQGLNLNNLQRYYVTVKASTEVGNVTVSSDGVVIIDGTDILQDIQLYDGQKCALDNSSDWGPNTPVHHDYDRRGKCEEDIDFQASTNSVSAYWTMAEEFLQFITRAEWALQREETLNSSYALWDFVTEFHDFGTQQYINVVELSLLPGHHYRSFVRFCHPDGCFQSVVSDGFWIISQPPVTMDIQDISYNESGTLTFEWHPFEQQELSHILDENPLEYYGWCLNVKTTANWVEFGDLLFPWQKINSIHYENDMLQATVSLPSDELEFTDCIRLGLRGYNKAGLYSDIYKDIKDCEAFDPRHVIPNIVIDSVGDFDGTEVRDIILEENAHWQYSDAEYTLSQHKLSAVWPTLRHGVYEWKIVAYEGLDRRAYQTSGNSLAYKSYQCDAPEVLACGQTQNNYVNVDNLQLQHGQRYYVCVRANETLKVYEKAEHILPEVSLCSDGVVVDLTPPTHGKVWIGWNKATYQTSTSDLVVHWDEFYDVEEHGQTTHHSGIRKYETAVGTSPNGVDVKNFKDVGVTNWVVVHNLYLQGGHTYYVTVKAFDFVGRSAESISDGITVDVTPPTTSGKEIDVGGSFVTSTSSLPATWNGVFDDVESGIDYYEWCIGSKPGIADVFPCTATNQKEILTDDTNSMTLLQGHVYYVTVKAYNGVGLSTTVTSWGVVVDGTPPKEGAIYDGVVSEDSADKDFQTNLDSLGARWDGFHDPHTTVVGYSVKIGSCPGCDDVIEENNVGILTEMTATDLGLQPGIRYYTTVTACNAADLCTTVTSDGIIADDSPPIAGMVYDGISDVDHSFQSSRTTLAAHWYNFHDPHTQLSHYEWFAGTTPGGDDVFEPIRLHLTEKAFISHLNLPVNTPLYVTVRAYNRAGLYTESSSNGIIVDQSPPAIANKIQFVERVGSITRNTQVWRSVLRIQWEFSDPESPIENHVLSVFTHHQSDMSIPPVKVGGSVREYTFTNLTLHDGNTYYVKVVACNAAKLCTESETEGILIDSSPPTVGTFAVETDHAAGLTRHRDGWMTYHQSQGDTSASVNLAWLGFADLHSGISHYGVTVGTNFGLWDLTQGLSVSTDYIDGVSHYDEGSVQTLEIPLIRDLVPGEHIYCTIWAVNGVGLRSYEAHETFVIVRSNDASGVLSILRRCDVQSCARHCTCAPQNQLCLEDYSPCNDVSGDSDHQQIEVFDVLDYHDDHDNYKDYDYTPSTCTIAAKWRNIGSGIAIQRYEWTAGSKGETPGAGLLDPAKERIWHEAGLDTFVVFSLKNGSLDHDTQYVFYVKAWYDDQTYAVFESDGIQADITNPTISTSRKVKDITDGSNLIDIDYSSNPLTLGVSWKNVFPDKDEISHFLVAISSHIQGEDVRPFNLSVHEANVSKVIFSDLNLQTGHTYYSNVMAVNHAGLYTIASSDGVTVDTIPPSSGSVYDGRGIHDVDYQNSSIVVSASWHGFSDLHSSIHHYLWCVGSQPGHEDVLPCQDVGLHLANSTDITTPITLGLRYYSKVVAVDAAGLQSDVAVSNGVTIDTTPPQNILNLLSHSNIVVNPSFEDFETQSENNDTDCKYPSVICLPKDWQMEGTGHVIQSANLDAQSGSAYLILHGSVSQTITTTEGEKYKVSFYISHLRDSSVPILSQEGYVQIPGLHRVFKLYQRTGSHGNGDVDWYEHVYYFTAKSRSSMVKIGSLGERNGLAVDNVAVQHLHIDDHDYLDVNQPIAKSCIHVHTRTNGKLHSVSASWDIVDPESPIIEFTWAIGTIKGGTQVQSFTAIGRSAHAFADDILLTHGIPIHVTVTARNAADLVSVFYSEEVVIDVSPPNVCCVKDGNEGADLSYQTSDVITIRWHVVDDESGVEFCEWAIGLSPSSATLSPFTVTDTLHTAEKDLSGLLLHGHTVYCTIRCRNFAGLYSQVTSSGVTIVKQRPAIDDAIIRLVASSPSMYETRGNHQSRTDNINIVWDGFEDISGISYYECRLLGEGYNADPDWNVIGQDGQMAGMVSGISMRSYKIYQLQLRAVNNGGMKSDILSSDVSVETSHPIITGNKLHYTWSASDVIQLDWNQVFLSNSTMIYDITISTVLGGSNIIKWYETRQATYVFGADRSMEYFVTIVAVNEAGLHNIYNDVLSYT